MDARIDLNLFASLRARMPANAAAYPITAGATVGEILDGLGISRTEAKLIFVDGVKTDPDRLLHGGERVGVFPPVGGG